MHLNIFWYLKTRFYRILKIICIQNQLCISFYSYLLDIKDQKSHPTQRKYLTLIYIYTSRANKRVIKIVLIYVEEKNNKDPSPDYVGIKIFLMPNTIAINKIIASLNI